MPEPTPELRDKRALPDKPNLDHLKGEAKERLKALRLAAPDCRLAEAQFQIARAYGFTSWRALKAEVDRRAGGGRLARYVGAYRHDPAVLSNSILEITARGGRLFINGLQGSRLELVDLGDGAFSQPGLLRSFQFAGVDAQPASTEGLTLVGMCGRCCSSAFKATTAPARRASSADTRGKRCSCPF